MKPYKVLLFFACVLACLAALCLVLPGRVAFAGTEVRWPTLAKVMGNSEHGIEGIEQLDTLERLDTLDTPAPPEKSEERLPIPKITVDSTTDSRIFLQSFYASLSQTGERRVRCCITETVR